MFNKIVSGVLILVIILTAISIILSFSKDDEARNALSLRAMTSFVYNEEIDRGEIPYYLDNSVHSFLDISQVDICYLTDKKNFTIELENCLIEKNTTHKYLKHSYYGYVLSFDVPHLEINLDKAFIILRGESELTIEIGSFKNTYSPAVGNEVDLSLDELYGIIDTVLETPSGIIMKLYNKTEKAILVNGISFGNGIVASGKEIKEIDDTVYSSKTDISSILGYKYSLYDSYESVVFQIPPYAAKRIIIPLKYLNNCYMYKCPLFISYDDKEMVINEFMFYDNHFSLDLLQKVVIKNAGIS